MADAVRILGDAAVPQVVAAIPEATIPAKPARTYNKVLITDLRIIGLRDDGVQTLQVCYTKARVKQDGTLEAVPNIQPRVVRELDLAAAVEATGDVALAAAFKKVHRYCLDLIRAKNGD